MELLGLLGRREQIMTEGRQMAGAGSKGRHDMVVRLLEPEVSSDAGWWWALAVADLSHETMRR